MPAPRARAVRRRILMVVAVSMAVVLAAGCEPSTSYAAKVGDTTISQDELSTWLDALAGSKSLRQNIFGSDAKVDGASSASYDMSFVSGVLGILVQRALIDQEIEARKLPLDPALDKQAEDQIVPVVKNELKAAEVDVPDSFYTDLVALFTHQSQLVKALGNDVQTWVDQQFSRDDIHVNPKFGTWASGGSVTPPAGPLASPAGT